MKSGRKSVRICGRSSLSTSRPFHRCGQQIKLVSHPLVCLRTLNDRRIWFMSKEEILFCDSDILVIVCTDTNHNPLCKKVHTRLFHQFPFFTQILLSPTKKRFNNPQFKFPFRFHSSFTNRTPVKIILIFLKD